MSIRQICLSLVAFETDCSRGIQTYKHEVLKMKFLVRTSVKYGLIQLFSSLAKVLQALKIVLIKTLVK